MGTLPGSSNRHTSRRRRRHSRRELRPAATPYVLALVALAMIGIGGVMAWQALEYFFRASAPSSPRVAAAATANSTRHGARWQVNVLDAFEQAARQVQSGESTGAEVQVDQAAAAMEEARVRSKPVTNDFFSRATAELDAILKAQPASAPAAETGDSANSAGALPGELSSTRLLEHVTQARIELAALRSAQNPIPPGDALASDAAAQAGDNAVAAPVNLLSSAAAANAGKFKPPSGHVLSDGPREVAANQTVDPAFIGGTFLDASLLPDTSEILLPPETRQFADNVRVQDLTIAGASQTLDGIHWRNVTFIGTRLRYEDGPIDLQNVRFLHCTFGFPSDQRGAAIANAIALGQTSLTIP